MREGPVYAEWRPHTRINMIGKTATILCAILLSLSLRYVYVFQYAGFNRMAEGIGGDAEDYLEIAYSISKAGVFGHMQGIGVKKACWSSKNLCRCLLLSSPTPSGLLSGLLSCRLS